MNGLYALIGLAFSACIAALLETWWHRRKLNRIPIRIHVNGTRGKSSVARLIAAGLREGGIRTCAKTTGTLARMIFCDGKELPIFRPARANIIEQKRVVRSAVDDQAEALVVECMALQPILQSVCELKLVRSTHGVITNAREDHLDVMGPTRLDVARALAGTVPVNGTLFTAEERADSLQILGDATQDRKSQLINVDRHEWADISTEDLVGFSYLEHAENVALALKVCESLGIDRQTALQGMWSAQPDPGAMRVFHRTISGQAWHFVNAFAANDPESTERIWEAAYDRFPKVTQRIAVMNCRVDRPNRSITMASACAKWRRADKYLIMGSGTDIFLRRLLKLGVDSDRIVCLGDATGQEIIQAMHRWPVKDTMMMGLGNVAGSGMGLVNHFANDGFWRTDAAEQKTTHEALEFAYVTNV